jgi:hypothetical protein
MEMGVHKIDEQMGKKLSKMLLQDRNSWKMAIF